MIRAVYRDGAIQPVDRIPPDWRDGDELVVDAISSAAPPESFEDWVAELNAAAAEISDEDHARMEAALEEIEARSKELGRREMERSEKVFSDELDDKPTRQAG
jgi:hypothetical protein